MTAHRAGSHDRRHLKAAIDDRRVIGQAKGVSIRGRAQRLWAWAAPFEDRAWAVVTVTKTKRT